MNSQAIIINTVAMIKHQTDFGVSNTQAKKKETKGQVFVYLF